MALLIASILMAAWVMATGCAMFVGGDLVAYRRAESAVRCWRRVAFAQDVAVCAVVCARTRAQ